MAGNGDTANLWAGLPLEPEISSSNRKLALGLATLSFALVVSFEWISELEFSLGIFYVFPVIAAATVLNRGPVLLLALFCAFVRGQFINGLATHEFWLRFAMATLAYSGVGLFVVELTRNRARVLAAYARLRLEQEMRQRAEDQLRILVESSPAGIVTLNRKGEAVAANRAAQEMLGFPSHDDLIGQNIAEAVPLFAGALRLTSDMPVRTAASSWARRANGVTFPVATWFSTYGHGEGRCLAGILVDSSEEVREREQEHFRHMLDYNRLLAGAVSHEIRNICLAIRVVMTNVHRKQALQDDADFAALDTLMGSLSSVAAFDLTNDKKAEGSWINLRTVFEQLRIVIEPDWKEAGGSVEWRLEPPNLRTVYADPHGLSQILLNLTKNSLRAAREIDAPKLEIAASQLGNTVQVSVVDNGPGVANPQALFQPFRPEADGSGLGLFISRALARSFGAQLQFVRTDSGCRFDVVLLADTSMDATPK